MAGIGVNVDVMQTLNPTAQTGAKFFGSGLATDTLNNPNAKNKNEIFFYIGIAAAVGVFFLFMKGR
jgi:hypothetical protein